MMAYKLRRHSIRSGNRTLRKRHILPSFTRNCIVHKLVWGGGGVFRGYGTVRIRIHLMRIRVFKNNLNPDPHSVDKNEKILFDYCIFLNRMIVCAVALALENVDPQPNYDHVCRRCDCRG
jgi:hypothetical protein